MKIQTFLYILAGLTILLAIISLIRYSIFASNEDEKSSIFWKKLGQFSFRLFLIIFLSNHVVSGKDSYYNFRHEQEFNEKHGLPQLDSTMLNIKGSKTSTLYFSWSTDSILHKSKFIDYDIFDVNSVSDKFYNSKENLYLESIFIKQNIFRDSSNIYILTKLNDSGYEKSDTITKQSFDNLISDWGLSDKIYKKFEINK